MKLNLLVFSALTFLLISCDPIKKLARTFDPTGSWDYMVKNTPMGDLPGTLMLAKSDAGWTGKMKSSEGELDLENIVWEGKTMKGTFDYQGTPMNLNLTVPPENNSSFTGMIKSSFGDFDVEGTKKMTP